MCAKEIAQDQKLSYLMNIFWRNGFLNGPRFDSFLSKSKAKVRNVFALEFSLLEVEFDVMLHQAL